MKMMRGYSIVDQNGDIAIIEESFPKKLKVRYLNKGISTIPKDGVVLVAKQIADAVGI